MSRRASDREYRRAQTVIAAVYVLLISILTIVSARADEEPRSSMSRHYVDGGRDGALPSAQSADEFAALRTEGERRRPHADNATRPGSAGAPGTARATVDDFWFYTADVILFGDDDLDGYHYGIDLLFDADTVWSSAWVYAVVYLSLDGGPWNEYASTEDFRIFGATSDDEYVLVTELQSGYPTGDYDVLIELFEADTGEYLADFGPESSSALSWLPLEDYNRDAPSFDRPVTVSRGHGGGSIGSALLLVLAGTALLRRRRSFTGNR